jgi:thymidylate synthase
MNMFGFIHFNHAIIAAGVAQRSGKPVQLGRLNWQADSFHIYGKDLESANQRLFQRLETTKFADRVFNFRDPDIQEMYQQAEAEIMEKIREEDAKPKIVSSQQ